MTRRLHARQNEVTAERTLNCAPSLADFDDTSYMTARKTNPYRTGDVVRVDPGVEALVVNTMVRRVIEGDPWSSLLPLCKVRKKTAKGEWSKVWTYAWPGDIQRGYEAA
jgi:hypothetical protein